MHDSYTPIRCLPAARPSTAGMLVFAGGVCEYFLIMLIWLCDKADAARKDSPMSSRFKASHHRLIGVFLSSFMILLLSATLVTAQAAAPLCPAHSLLSIARAGSAC